jgi:hypothetical protein
MEELEVLTMGEEDFEILLQNTLKSITENQNMYRLLISVAIASDHAGQAATKWADIATKITQGLIKHYPDARLNTDRFILRLAHDLSMYYNAELKFNLQRN